MLIIISLLLLNIAFPFTLNGMMKGLTEGKKTSIVNPKKRMIHYDANIYTPMAQNMLTKIDTQYPTTKELTPEIVSNTIEHVIATATRSHPPKIATTYAAATNINDFSKISKHGKYLCLREHGIDREKADEIVEQLENFSNNTDPDKFKYKDGMARVLPKNISPIIDHEIDPEGKLKCYFEIFAPTISEKPIPNIVSIKNAQSANPNGPIIFNQHEDGLHVELPKQFDGTTVSRLPLDVKRILSYSATNEHLQHDALSGNTVLTGALSGGVAMVGWLLETSVPMAGQVVSAQVSKRLGKIGPKALNELHDRIALNTEMHLYSTNLPIELKQQMAELEVSDAIQTILLQALHDTEQDLGKMDLSTAEWSNEWPDTVKETFQKKVENIIRNAYPEENDLQETMKTYAKSVVRDKNIFKGINPFAGLVNGGFLLRLLNKKA
ncbi:hypothetical protein IPH25_00330 [bacterium]|nr:MAG: hypothetical protein IPG37_02445 [bacterium]QQR61880.1 MAG: hypothetical protein IPH25_00330 [bacterium]